MLANSAIFKLIMSYIGMIIGNKNGSLTILLGNDGQSYLRIAYHEYNENTLIIDFTACDSNGDMVGYMNESIGMYRIMELDNAICFGKTTIYIDRMKSIMYGNDTVYTRD